MKKEFKTYEQRMKGIYKSVEAGDIESILEALSIAKDDVVNYVFESASCVIGLKNFTCIDVCFTPESIFIWIEPENPIFDKTK